MAERARSWRRAQVVPTPPPTGVEPARLVDALFEELLGRPPDPRAAAHFAELISNGHDLREVIRWIVSSEEAAQHLPAHLLLPILRRVVFRYPVPERPVFFLHIMKTGGTAVREALLRLAQGSLVISGTMLDDLVCLPPYVLERTALLSAHLPYEVTRLLPPNTLTFTVLRDPVERAISHYWHLRNDPAMVLEFPDFSLEEFVESPLWSPLSTNYQARYLTHEVGVDRAWVDWAPLERFSSLGPLHPPTHRYPLQTFFDCSPLALDQDELTRAGLERLEEIELVGVTDHLNGIFAQLAGFFGERNPGTVDRVNVGQDRPAVSSAPASLVERIRQRNQADYALYERARERSAAASSSR